MGNTSIITVPSGWGGGHHLKPGGLGATPHKDESLFFSLAGKVLNLKKNPEDKTGY